MPAGSSSHSVFSEIIDKNVDNPLNPHKEYEFFYILQVMDASFACFCSCCVIALFLVEKGIKALSGKNMQKARVYTKFKGEGSGGDSLPKTNKP